MCVFKAKSSYWDNMVYTDIFKHLNEKKYFFGLFKLLGKQYNLKTCAVFSWAIASA